MTNIRSRTPKNVKKKKVRDAQMNSTPLLRNFQVMMTAVFPERGILGLLFFHYSLVWVSTESSFEYGFTDFIVSLSYVCDYD